VSDALDLGVAYPERLACQLAREGGDGDSRGDRLDGDGQLIG
jgi:hypothetical protein